MSAEFWGIIGVGVAMVGLHWRTLARIDALNARMDALYARLDGLSDRIGGLEQRLARVEATLDRLIQGLHIEVRGKGGPS